VTPLLFGLALLGAAEAAEPQYRQLRLVDGRVLTAQILATESDGLALQLPQGRALVPFDLLVDMLPTDALTYQEQPDWSVWVIADEPAADELFAAFASIDGVRATPVGDGAPEAVAAASRACDGDLDCIARVSADSGWRWLVRAEPKGGGQVRLTSRTNATSDPTSVRVTTSLDRIDDRVHELLGLERPYEPPPSVAVGPAVVTPEPEGVEDGPIELPKSERRKVLVQSFVPLPGYPSLKRGDTRGLATSLAIVVPATAVWVGAVGQGSQNAGEFTALSLIGFYGATVLTNQVMGLRSLERQQAGLAMGPTERGGPQLVVGARF